jgi:hypothetical protein
MVSGPRKRKRKWVWFPKSQTVEDQLFRVLGQSMREWMKVMRVSQNV